jgi:putative PIN family toxin of toxin-antitoxin system
MRIADTPLDSTAHQPWAVVLDTNVVLDWLVFSDASCSSLAEQLIRGQLRWQATAEMRSELCSVLPRPELKIWNPDGEHVLSVFDRLASLHAPSRVQQPAAGLRCRDPDDQKFMDLALATSARWLFSRDRALLDLAKTARKHGVEILTPASWLRQHASLASHGDSGGIA